MQNQIQSLISGLASDLQQVGVIWQLAVLAASFGAAWWISRLVRPHVTTETIYRKPGAGGFSAAQLGAGGVHRVIFPLSALALVLVGKALLRQWQPVNLLSLAVPLLMSLAIIRIVVYMLRYIFAPGKLRSGSERLISWLVWVGFALYISGLTPEIAGTFDEIGFHIGRQRISLLLFLQGAVSVSVALLLMLWAGRLAEGRIMASTAMDVNLRVVFSKLVRALLVVLGLLIALPAVGIDITVLSVFGGALGVGLGFGLQKIASNYVSGFIILLDRSISMGDVVTVDNRYGEVTQLTARYVVLKSTDGTEAIIPNDTIITSTVINHSYTNRQVRLEIPVQVAYASPLDAAMQIMLEAARAQPRILHDPEPVVLVKSLADNGIVLELAVWITDPEHGKTSLLSDIYLHILRAFQRAGVEIPFPQRDVRIVHSA